MGRKRKPTKIPMSKEATNIFREVGTKGAREYWDSLSDEQKAAQIERLHAGNKRYRIKQKYS